MRPRRQKIYRKSHVHPPDVRRGGGRPSLPLLWKRILSAPAKGLRSISACFGKLGQGRLRPAELRTKQGGYITEAAIIVPMFILATIALIGIVPVIAMGENVVWCAADEIRQEGVLCRVNQSPGRMPVLLEARAHSESSALKHLYIESYDYLVPHGNIEDLIRIRFRAKGGVHDPLGNFDDIRFRGTVVGRAFTGRVRDGSARSSFEDDDSLVWIFPEDGVRYHQGSCQHVKASCRMVPLSEDVRSSYHPCPNCSAKTASIGTPVYVFDRDGEAYHYGDCRSVDRWCEQATRSHAEELGYTPCTVCGG